MLDRDCSEDVDKFAELGDMQVEAGYDRFGVEGEAETDIPAEKETQSEWSLKECQEMLGEVTAEETMFHGLVEETDEPMEEMQEILSKFPPDNCANEPEEPLTKNVPEDVAVAANEEPASMDLPIKKDPMQDVVQ